MLFGPAFSANGQKASLQEPTTQLSAVNEELSEDACEEDAARAAKLTSSLKRSPRFALEKERTS